MTEIIDICETETSYAHEDFCQIVDCALDEDPPEALFISIESNLSAKFSGNCLEADDCRDDYFGDYYIYPTIIGTGNDSCVRECLQGSTGKIYAVKTIEKSNEVNGVDPIQREIELLYSIDHPAILKMVDCFEDEHNVHIVTDRYTGGELYDRIVDRTTDNGCFPENQAAKIAKSLLEAVQYLHIKDIVHRDIKPENLIFETSEEGSNIRLIDFGLSRTHGPTDSAMTDRVGTPYYMSPGILRGKYDRTCDLWAIGVISYILLCGYPPFEGSTDEEVFESVRRGNLVFEEHVWGNLSNTSRDFVSKLLCTDSSKIGTAADALRHPWVFNA